MAYADNILKDSSENQFFVLLKPRKMLLGTLTDGNNWTLVSGSGWGIDPSVYSQSFDFGGIVLECWQLDADDTSFELTEAASASGLADEHFFFNRDTKTLYVRNDSTDLNVRVTWALTLSTKEQVAPIDPSDEDSEQVFWTGCVIQAPGSAMSTDLQNFGFVPIDNTNLRVNNDKNLFQKFMHDASFNKAEIICWHQCGRFEEENVEKILTGVVSGRVAWTANEISFDISDKIAQLDSIFTYGGDGSEDRLSLTDFGSDSHALDPSADGQPIRFVYGRVRGYVPVNIDYNSESPTTSNNRKWVVGHGQTVDFWDSYTATIVAVYKPSATIVGVKVANADAKFFAIGDRLWVDKTAALDEWTTITDIVLDGVNCILMTGDLAGASFTGSVKKSFVQNVFLVDEDNNKWFQLEYGRDYTETNFSQNTRGFTLTSSAESNVSAGTFDPSNFKLFCDVLGKQTMPQIGGVDFDALRNTDYHTHLPSGNPYRNCYGAIFRVAHVIYDFLKSRYGLSEAEIDTDSFIYLDSVIKNPVGFAVPQKSNEEFPAFKDVLNTLLTNAFSKAYFDNNGLFVVKPIERITSSSNTISKEEMFSTNIEYDYTNLTRIREKSLFREFKINLTYRASIGLDDAQTNFILVENVYGGAGTATPPFATDDDGGAAPSGFGGSLARFLNEIDKETTIDSYASDGDGVVLNEQHLYFERIYNMRSCKITTRSKTQLIQKNIGDSIEVTRDDLPGFDPGSDNSRFAEIVRIQKNGSEVQTIFDDQIGIQGL